MSKCTLRMKPRLLLSIAEYVRLAERPDDAISLVEIEKAASRWSRQLAFAEKLACQAVAGILHSTRGWVAHLSQPSPDCTRTGNGLRPDVG